MNSRSLAKTQPQPLALRQRPQGRLDVAALLRHAVLVLVAAVSLYAILRMLSSSFKSPHEVFEPTASLLPKDWVFTNYAAALRAAPFGRFFYNSVVVAAISVTAQLVSCSLAAFAFAKIDFVGRRALFFLILVGMMIPGEAAIIPNYILVTSLGLRNSALGIAATSLCSVFTIFLLRQHMLLIPDALLEAAEIDGAGALRRFLVVVIPNTKGALATSAILAFMGSWNDYMWPYLMSDIERARTVQIGLKYMIDPDLGPQWPVVMAAATS